MARQAFHCEQAQMLSLFPFKAYAACQDLQVLLTSEGQRQFCRLLRWELQGLLPLEGPTFEAMGLTMACWDAGHCHGPVLLCILTSIPN